MDPKEEMIQRSDDGLYAAFRLLDMATSWLAFPIALAILGIYWIADRRRK